MGEVCRIGAENDAEDVPAFLRRAGPHATEAIGYRFGWNSREALKRLKGLEQAGLVKRSGWHITGGGPGGWRSVAWEAA